MSLNKKVSVVVPVYNMGKYLERCVKTVLIDEEVIGEIIIIDDGSTDDTLQECKKISELDSRIRIINIPHSGLLSARNTAINCCTTEYISFVDADDWVDKGIFTDAVNFLDNNSDIDIYINGMYREDADGIKRSMYSIYDHILIYDHEEALLELLRATNYKWELCGKIYRRFLFQDYDLDEKVTIGEDLYRNWFLFNRAKKVAVNSEPKYHYFFHPNSMVLSSEYRLQNMYTVFKKIIDSEFDKADLFIKPFLVEQYYKALVYQIKLFCMDGVHKNKKRILELQNELKSLHLLKTDDNQADSDYSLILNISIDKYGRYDDLVKAYTFLYQLVTRKLIEVKRTYPEFYFYGTGTISTYISKCAVDNGIEWEGYIISDTELNKKFFFGKNVHRVSDLNLSDDYVIVLAVSNKYSEEITQGLNSRGVSKVIPFAELLLPDYDITEWM